MADADADVVVVDYVADADAVRVFVDADFDEAAAAVAVEYSAEGPAACSDPAYCSLLAYFGHLGEYCRFVQPVVLEHLEEHVAPGAPVAFGEVKLEGGCWPASDIAILYLYCFPAHYVP